MAWIETKRPDDPQVAKVLSQTQPLYPMEYTTPVPALARYEKEGAAIVMAHSLIPDAMLHAFSTFGVLMSDDLPLARRDHELIATTVSALNDCFY